MDVLQTLGQAPPTPQGHAQTGETYSFRGRRGVPARLGNRHPVGRLPHGNPLPERDRMKRENPTQITGNTLISTTKCPTAQEITSATHKSLKTDALISN